LAAGFAFGKSGGQARFAKDQFGSEKPKVPLDKPAGFIQPPDATGSDLLNRKDKRGIKEGIKGDGVRRRKPEKGSE